MYIVDDNLESIDDNDPMTYKLSSLKKVCNEIVNRFEDFTFMEVRFENITTKNKSKKVYTFSEMVGREIKVLTISNIFEYCDYINSSYGILTLYSGQSSLSSAIKNSGGELQIFCLITALMKLQHEENSGYIFDNINFIEC
jgi:hypothetical protein